MEQEIKQSSQAPAPARDFSLFLLIAAIILAPLAYLKLTVESHIALKDLVIGVSGTIIFFIALVNSVSNDRTKVKYCALDVFLVLFILYSLATVYFSINKGEGVLTWAAYPPLLVIYFYVSRNGEGIADRVIPAISVSATIIAVITLALSLMSWGRLGDGSAGAMVRLKDILVFPLGGNNYTAAFLTFALPATASLKDGTGIRSFRNKALAIQAAAIAACFGRIAIVISLVFALCWLVSMIAGKSVAKDWRGPAAIVLGMVLTASLFFIMVSNEPRQTVVQDLMISPDGAAEQGIDSMHMRLFWWKDATRMIVEHPAGVGLGAFGYVFPGYRTIPETFIYPEARLTTPHNDYLHVLSETGYPGFAIYIGALLLGLVGAAYGVSRKETNLSETAFFSLSVMLVFAAYSIADFPLIMPACRLILFIALGFSAAMLMKKSTKEFSAGGALSYVGYAVLFCALIIPGTMWVKNFAAQTHVLKQINSLQNPKVALEEFGKAIAINPDTKYAHKYAGSIYDRSGDCAKSIDMFKKALELDPNDYNIINYMGVSYARCGKSDEALAAFKKAAEIYPNYANPHLNAGVLLLQEGNEKRAAEHFRTALALNKNLVEVYIQLAQVEMQAGNYQAAAQIVRKALDIKPNNQVLMAQMYEIHNAMNASGAGGKKRAGDVKENDK